MRFEALLLALRRPEAWPAGETVEEVRETHASVVFLTARHAWKIKRPIDLGFLDYSTLAKRQSCCEAEVRLNTPRAPAVYLGVVPIAHHGEGVRVGGDGAVVEWAVQMRRLPDEASLLHQVDAGIASAEQVAAVGVRLAGHHRDAERSRRIASFGRPEVALRNLAENFEQSRPEIGLTVSSDVFARLEAAQRAELTRLAPVMAGRVKRGVPCDTHGDLRLDHVYALPEGIAFVDCIEFNERFRYADPVADLAFLVMDLAVRGERRLARVLADAWFTASQDEEARILLPFWSSYRSVVRGKVAGFLLRDPAIGEAARAEALARARRHWLFALGELVPPGDRPVLVGVGGLPGTGKTTLATALARDGGFEVVRSDQVRKELAHLPQAFHPRGAMRDEMYSEQAKDGVYHACFARASELLFAGRPVVVDASFWKERWRLELVRTARSLGVPAHLFLCRTSEATALARLAARRGDASDADMGVYRTAVAEWEPLGPITAGISEWIPAEDADPAVATALRAVRAPPGEEEEKGQERQEGPR